MSGISGLVYEVVWLDRIRLVMGHTVYALSTILAAYLSGMALGALASPRIIRSRISALWLYLIAELMIGIYGLAFHNILKLVQIPYSMLCTRYDLSMSVMSLVQFVFCGFIIIIPTFLMGITLPVLAHFLYTSDNELSVKIPSLYAVNTLGACFGCIGSGFFLLPHLGLTRTTLVAVSINLTLFIIPFLILKKFKPPSFAELLSGLRNIWSYKHTAFPISRSDWNACLLLFISGFSSMLVQISWNRLAGLNFGSSVYIFSQVTTVVLLGIVAGSLAFRKFSSNPERIRTIVLFLPWTAALFLVISNALFTHAAFVILYIHHNFKPAFFAYTLSTFLLMLIFLFPAAFLLGALFPSAATLITKDKKNQSHALGFGYALNISGLLAGGLLGAFIILPQYGVESLEKVVFIVLVSTTAIFCLSMLKSIRMALAVVIVSSSVYLFAPSYDWSLLTSGFFYDRENNRKLDELTDQGVTRYLKYFGDYKSVKEKMLVRKDDPHATISLHADPDPRYLNLKIDGKYDGGNHPTDMQTTRILGLLPFLFQPDAKSSLIIGLGIGTTAAETLRYPEMERSDIVELSHAVIDIAKEYFQDVNRSLWNNPKVHLYNRDGREFLNHTENKYDLIISEPPNPWTTGTASLFTAEFYQSVKNRLNDDGIASLWFHSYGLRCEAIMSVFAAVTNVFENVIIFKLDSDFYLIAGKNTLNLNMLPPDLINIENRLFRLAKLKISNNRLQNYKMFLGKTLFFDGKTILTVQGNQVTVNNDDNQYLQYSSGRGFWRNFGDCDVINRAKKAYNPVLNTVFKY